MPDPTYIHPADPADGVAWIVLARPKNRNAYDPVLLYNSTPRCSTRRPTPRCV
jgi:enoyl-CoA hydratase/carnithine racemase